jgi:hypothetical protein
MDQKAPSANPFDLLQPRRGSTSDCLQKVGLRPAGEHGFAPAAGVPSNVQAPDQSFAVAEKPVEEFPRPPARAEVGHTLEPVRIAGGQNHVIVDEQGPIERLLAIDEMICQPVSTVLNHGVVE